MYNLASAISLAVQLPAVIVSVVLATSVALDTIV